MVGAFLFRVKTPCIRQINDKSEVLRVLISVAIMNANEHLYLSRIALSIWVDKNWKQKQLRKYCRRNKRGTRIMVNAVSETAVFCF